MQDQEIITAIREGGSAKRQAAHFVFSSNLGMMHRIKGRLSLNSEQIKDTYADAVSAVIWNIDTNIFVGDSKLSTYLYRILFNKSVDLIRSITTNKNEAYLDLSDNSAHLVHDDLSRQLETKLDVIKIKDEILQLGEPCSSVILDWGYWGYKMSEIAARNGLESAEKAKKKKYNCLKKLQAILNAKGIVKDEN